MTMMNDSPYNKCIIFPKGKTTWEGFQRPFKDGDIVFYNDSRKEIRLATEEEKQKLFDAIKQNGYRWNEETKTLEKLPKFKVGDRIQWYGTITQSIRVVKSLECDRYRLDNGNYIKFGDEHAYKLLKFDINTLKPFDKVLVRSTNKDYWNISYFGYIANCDKQYFMCIANTGFYQCIPYTNETKHLLGTTNDCDNFFKTWEEL